MVVLALNTNYSHYFTRLGRDRTKIPLAVNLVLGTDSFECSGIILARHSEVLLEMILQSREIYLDDFTRDREVLEDCIDLLHGGEVEVGLGNIQGLMKFGLNYKVGDLVKTCLGWVQSNISKNNLAALLKVGFFVSSLSEPNHDVLDACKSCFLEMLQNFRPPYPSSEEVTKALSLTRSLEDDTQTIALVMVMEDKFIEANYSVLEVLTDWIISEDMADMILAQLKRLGLFESFFKVSEFTAVRLIEKVNQYIQSNVSLRILNELQCGFMKYKLNNSVSRNMIEGILDDKNALTSFRARLPPPLKQEYVYAELLLEWIWRNKTTHNMDDASVKRIWSTINQGKLCYPYIVKLRDAIVEFTFTKLPLVIDLGDDYELREITLLNPVVSDIKSRLLNKTAGLKFACPVAGCELEDTLFLRLQLGDSVPCYSLDGNGMQEKVHFHPGLMKHWYLSIDTNDDHDEEIDVENDDEDYQTDIFSLVTHSLEEVLEVVEDVGDHQVLNLHCLIDNKFV